MRTLYLVASASGRCGDLRPGVIAPYSAKEYALLRWQLENANTTDSLKVRPEQHTNGDVNNTCWSGSSRRFPVEVWQNIVYALFDFDFDRRWHWERGSPSRVMLPKLCLVCKQICRAVRPLIFRTLNLKSPKDISFLRTMLQSEVSAWLADHIEFISTMHTEDYPQVTALLSRVSGI